MEDVPNIDSLIKETHNRTGKNNEIRDRILANLIEPVTSMNMDPNDLKPSDIEARCALMGHVDSLMQSQEKAQLNVIKIALQQNSDSVDANVAEQTLAILRKINPSTDSLDKSAGDVYDPNSQDDAIAKVFSDSGETITDAELLATDS